MKLKKKLKNQKPIEFDIHLKYRCSKCNQEHWLSYQEASTKNFKIVCFCKNIFYVQRICAFKVKYFNSQKKQISSSIDKNALKKSANILVNYGFSDEEAKKLIKKSYDINPTNDCSLLVKQALELLKDKNINELN